MKKEDISFAAFIILIIVLILLSSCTTERKAAKYFNNHTLKAARYCDAHFPYIVQEPKPDSSYKPANNTDYTAQFDSLKTDLDKQLDEFKKAQNQHEKDTACANTIEELKNKYEKLMQSYLKLKKSYKPCNPDTLTIVKTKYVQSTAQSVIINEQAKTIDKITTSRNDWRLRAIVTWGILAVIIIITLIFKI